MAKISAGTSRLSGNQLEDDGSSVCVLSLACIGASHPYLSELMAVCVCHSDEVMREERLMLMIHLSNWGGIPRGPCR